MAALKMRHTIDFLSLWASKAMGREEEQEREMCLWEQNVIFIWKPKNSTFFFEFWNWLRLK